MLMITSDDLDSNSPFQKVETMILDVESLDSRPLGLWDEPIISFSISIPSSSITVWDAPTTCFIAENIGEEPKLLKLIRKIIWVNRKSTIAGHNISLRFKHISKEISWPCGYDLPKILKRGIRYGVDFNFVTKVPVFDSMDEAFLNYDHSAHNHLWKGEKQRILGCEHIEEDFNIVRPQWLPKLGPKVRDYYNEYLKNGKVDILKTISQYNACDTIVESIITKIFLHSLNECSACSKIVSPTRKCAHIPSTFSVESNPTWRRLKNATLARIQNDRLNL